MELTNNLRKLVASLDETKHRKRTGLFKCEGTKCVVDTIHSFKQAYLFATSDWLNNNPIEFDGEIIAVTSRDLERMSHLQTPPPVIAVCEIPHYEVSKEQISSNLTIALDGVQDPGNMGTIIRTADWFGVRQIVCSTDTVDAFSPKVVQATMGALSRVKIIYVDLPRFLNSLPKGTDIYGTFLGGDNIYQSNLSTGGIIVMGNEGKGISSEAASTINCRLTIPSYPVGAPTSESLNVAIATAVTLAEFRRRHSL